MGVARYIKDEKDRVKDVILQSGIHVKPLYKEKDLIDLGFDYDKDLGDPGQYPFTRGIHEQGFRSREWTTRQYSGFGTPKETNERWKLNVAFDLPTQMGYDSDDPMAEGEVGRVGMAVDSLKDFEIAFKDIALHKIGSGLTINAVASIMVAMYQAVAEGYGFSKEQISATPQNDILKEIVGRGAWIFPVEPAVRLVGDVIEYSVKEMPRANPVSVCGYHIREAGANPVQEIAYAIQIANAYIDNVLERGYKIDDFVGRFSFNLDVFGNLWEQVAKFRAARKLWAKNIKEKYGAKNEKSMFLRGIFGGGGGGLTKEEPENNIVRSAYYALAAALSGAQTMALCSYDEAYTIPTPHSALISLRTLQLLMDEVGLRDTVDPMAGSYFIEALTKEIEEKIVDEMAKIDKLGGMVKAISSGYIQKEVSRQAYEFERGVQSGELIKIGVNKYTGGEEGKVELHEYNDESAVEQIKSLEELKRTRNDKEVTRTLKALEKAARDKKNVMPFLVDCCKAYATVGEMTGVFRDIFGEFVEPSIF